MDGQVDGWKDGWIGPLTICRTFFSKRCGCSNIKMKYCFDDGKVLLYTQLQKKLISYFFGNNRKTI